MKSPTTLMKETWSVFTSHAMLFLTIYVVPAVIAVLFVFQFGASPETVMQEVGFSIAVIGSVLVMFLVNVLMGIAMIKAASDPEGTTIESAYTYALNNFFPYLWLVILLALIVIVGFICFIVPGIIFMVWFAFCYYILLFEGRTPIDSLKQSRDYVRGRWWQVFGRIMYMVLILIVISIAFGIVGAIGGAVSSELVATIISQIANFVVVPVSVIYMYHLYRDVSASATQPESETARPNGARELEEPQL